MFCKFCGKQIQDDARVCEHCGKELRAPEVSGKKPKGKLSTSQLVIILVAVVVCVALVAAVVLIGIQAGNSDSTEATVPATVPADGNPDDVTCKGSYTGEEGELLAAMDTVVATVGDAALTNGQLQIFYWMQFYEFYEQYYYYASALGLDVTQSLDTQLSQFTVGENGSATTWQQYFLSCALESWRRNQVLSDLAEAEGFTMPDSYRTALENIENDLLTSATEAGLGSVEELLKNDMGTGATLEAYKEYLQTYYTGYLYFAEQVDKIRVPESDVLAYYDENQDALQEAGVTKEDTSYVVDVRHILIQPVGDTEDATTFTDAQWEACRAEAQSILDQWLAGTGDEDSFAQLATEHTQDPGSQNTGGLYSNVTEGQMVTEFNDWIFQEDRQEGDYGLVKTSYGYHIMYFVGTTPTWYATCESNIISERSEVLLEQLLADAQLEVSYGDILLGEANLG